MTTEKKHTPIFTDFEKACVNGDLERVRRLVGLGENPFAGDNSGIFLAGAHNHLSVVKYLKSMGAPIYHLFSAMAFYFPENFPVEVARYLIEEGEDWKQSGVLAKCKSKEEALKFLELLRI